MKKFALTILALVVSGVPALFLAGSMADYGYLGSCFEGACAYTAVFFVFPLIWLAFFVALVMGWRLFKRK